MSKSTASPLDAARALPRDGYWALLYSGMRSQGSGSRSFLASQPTQQISSGGFDSIAQALHAAPSQRWFGYLGYGLRHTLEQLPADAPSYIHLPDYCLFAPSVIEEWDHAEAPPAAIFTPNAAAVAELRSNMNKAEYLNIVRATIERIRAGEFYQANITRKFTGRFETAPDAFALYESLCAVSPAPFSAYLQLGDVAVLSSSPEGFLGIDASGQCVTRPIKGSAPRGTTPAEDAALLAALQASEKDKAENLMIVDLMRNDLARATIAGSVSVSALQEIYSYATIHQMVSTVTAQKKPDASSLDVVKACFPPGSMTGTPKIRAMKWCSQQEKLARGVYSGAIGWLSESMCDLSVVIRTLLIQGDRFEFQVGGGIVADSDPQAEWAETMVKASAIAQVLGIPLDDLRAI